MKILKSKQCVIEPDGTMRMIYDDEDVELLDAGNATIARASMVEPGPGGWIADMSLSGGPILPAKRLREDALQAERKWLEASLFAAIR